MLIAISIAPVAPRIHALDASMHAAVAPIGAATPQAPAPATPNDLGSQGIAVKQGIADARDFFARHGVGAHEGNGPIDVELKPGMDNAAYSQARDGSEKIIMGENGESGLPYAYAGDVVAHEYAHRVISAKVGLEGSGEAGTVGESLADTFAAAIDPNQDWTIGETVKHKGVRSMDEPNRPQDAIETPGGKIERPADIRAKIETQQDQGGVHLNVGIPNKAAATIGKTLGKEAMGDIYMRALDNHITPDVDIAGLAMATLQSASELYGTDSRATQVVADAWKGVGFDVQRNRADSAA